MSRLIKPRTPLLVAGLAVAAFGVTGCAGLDGKVDGGYQCVERTDPNSRAVDDVRVRTVDPDLCDPDRGDDGSGFLYFVSYGGGYYGVPTGTSYVHSSSKDGGKPLISSTDKAARSAANVPSRIDPNAKVGRTSVRSGGFGSGRTGGG